MESNLAPASMSSKVEESWRCISIQSETVHQGVQWDGIWPAHLSRISLRFKHALAFPIEVDQAIKQKILLLKSRRNEVAVELLSISYIP